MTIDETIEQMDKAAEMWEKDAKKWFDYTRSFCCSMGATSGVVQNRK